MGYQLKGWTKTSGGSTVNYNFGATYTTNAALTLYPVWEALPPENTYVFQDPTKTTNNGYIC